MAKKSCVVCTVRVKSAIKPARDVFWSKWSTGSTHVGHHTYSTIRSCTRNGNAKARSPRSVCVPCRCTSLNTDFDFESDKSGFVLLRGLSSESMHRRLRLRLLVFIIITSICYFFLSLATFIKQLMYFGDLKQWVGRNTMYGICFSLDVWWDPYNHSLGATTFLSVSPLPLQIHHPICAFLGGGGGKGHKQLYFKIEVKGYSIIWSSKNTSSVRRGRKR